MKAVLVGLMLCAVVQIVVSGPVHAATADRVILPGVGVGPVHLGMTLEQVIAVWGPPLTSESYLTSPYPMMEYNWYPIVVGTGGRRYPARGGTSVSTNASGVVFSITVFADATYATPEGLYTSSLTATGQAQYVGATDVQVRAALDEPDFVLSPPPGGGYWMWIYYQRGLTLFFEDDAGALTLWKILVDHPSRCPS
jgi:hypothetical protein